MRRIIVLMLVAVCAAACATVYFFFPDAAGNIFTQAGAIVAQSWNDTFGNSHVAYVSAEIDLGASSTEQLPGADAEAAASDTINVGAQTAPATVPQTETITLPIPDATSSGVIDETAQSTSSTTQKSMPPPPCVIATSTNLSRRLIFNEIAWMGSPAGTGENASAASNREWLEVKNISGSTLDVSNWQILDAAGNIKIALDDDTHVPAGGLLLFERGEDAVPAISADKTYSGALSNAGAVLAIMDAVCGASDLVDASLGWPAGNNGTKQTLERNADTVGWHTSAAAGGTPKAENSVVAVPQAASTSTVVTSTAAGAGANSVTITASTTAANAATSTTIASTTTEATSTPTSTLPTACATGGVNHLLIAEVQIAGASSTNDFIKIFNPTVDAVDIDGWKLRKKSKSGADYSIRAFPDGNAVPAGGYFVWANSEDSFGDAMGANTTSTATLAADNSVALMNASGTIVDAVAWGEGTNQYVETAAYATNPEANQVLKRKSANGIMVDTDHNADDFAI